MAFVGLIAGLIYSVGGFFIDALVSLNFITSSETSGLSYGTVLAFGALIGMPLIAAIFGFVTGIIGSWSYNLFAKYFKEVNLNIKK